MNKILHKANDLKACAVVSLLPFFIGLFVFSSCNRKQSSYVPENTPGDSLTIIKNLEAREDSGELALAIEGQAGFTHVLTADLETDPVESFPGEDAADDPAIWVNTQDPENSRVLGTNKKGGLYVYDPEGRIVQYKRVGMINNVDLRDGFNYKGEEVVLVAGSNRSINAITFFIIDKESAILSDDLFNIYSEVDEVYGICLYRSTKKNLFYVFVNGKGGMVEQWLVDYSDKWYSKKVREFTLNSQPEGMVADDTHAHLYLGVEQEGIFRLEAEPKGDGNMVKLAGSDMGNPKIRYDIEGLALFDYKDKTYLIASSQGNFSYALFTLGDNGKYLTSFIIEEGIVDGVEETDGLDITTASINGQFSQGILVVQDGFNTNGDEDLNQNFKYVSFEKIAYLLD